MEIIQNLILFTEARDGQDESYVGLSMNTDVIHDGIIEELGSKTFSVLMVIASHANQEQECFPSYDRIQQLTGFSRATIAASIKFLCEFEIGGKKILIKRQKSIPKWKRNNYLLNTLEGISFEDC